ncbi:unnamed protein product [Ceutorhynchus assimilis]|uniref:Aminopeptidase n=1 Tax=Ceutorhynchus assimilis TaxID=467358 RepID=A0A9N9MX24_9CUCU|nr:unnamed protein product [Ceutorhynchus assimilis]
MCFFFLLKMSLKLLAILCIAPLVCSQNYRLSGTVEPLSYIVHLSIPTGVFTGVDDTFTGETKINFRVTSTNISEIQLHHRVKNVTVELAVNDLTMIAFLEPTYNETTEIYTIPTATPLSVDTIYTLTFTYSNTFEAKNMEGFYSSKYKNENNETSYLVTTQFQPTHARHAFPCFDEPQYKATFAVSLTYPSGLLALSNSLEDNTTEPVDGYVTTHYKETTRMSTYLVAFIISEFTCSAQDTIDNNVLHRVCSRQEEAQDRTWAVEVGPPLIRSLESMFGIKYGSYMPKMDQIAIPDFSAGAMENWGLVTYRETGLLFSEEDTAITYKKNIALVIAHEFTHMWFGNLVTCKWWDYTFLNEGFARYYQYFAAALTKQLIDWELEKHFNVEQVQSALLADSSLNAHALTSKSETQREISDKFSTISYNKGASIYRMIETNIMGAGNFIYGIRDYLSNNTLQATVPADLWSKLAPHVPNTSLPQGIDLTTVLNNWVEHSGHPVVKVAKSGNDVVLSQERFLLSGNDTTEYYVPITYTLSSDVTKFSNTTVKTWLIPGQSLTLTGVLTDNNWIILNNRQSGFYRVDYDSTLWSAIKAQLHSNHLAIDVLNRAQIISDAYNFARAGRNDGYGSWTYAELMSVLSYLEYEVDYYPWYAAITGHNHLLQRIGYDSEEGQLFINWMLKLMQNVYKTVPFDVLDSSNQVYSMKQMLILNRACKYGEAECVSKSKELFAGYRDKGVKVPKNLRNLVYCTALRHSDNIATDFNFLWSKFGETKLMSEILTILSGLGCTNDTATLKWYLGQTLNETAGIRLQDFTSVWTYVFSSGKVGTNAALEFIAENYQTLNDAYSNCGSLISSAANYIYDEDQLVKVEALVNLTGILDTHKVTAEKALVSAKDIISWAKTLKEDIRQFLADDNNDNTDNSGAVIHTSSVLLISVFIIVANIVF